MKFSDTFNKKAFNRPVGEDDSVDRPAPRQAAPYEARAAAAGSPLQKPEGDYGYGKSFTLNEKAEETPYYAGLAGDEEFSRFQDRVRRGKVKICDGCGGVMNKATRMILSPLAGALLAALGLALMLIYGLAINFLRPPWFIQFALPGSYYMGALFITVGILFFFIREKVWVCHKCKEIRKR